MRQFPNKRNHKLKNNRRHRLKNNNQVYILKWVEEEGLQHNAMSYD